MAKSEIKMKMSLDSSGVKAGLAKAKAGIANFARSGVEKLTKLAKAASVGLVAGFAAAAKSAISYGKEVKNLSQISNTSLEEFQKMAYAAKSVGIEQDKLSDILKDMNDRVGDFVQTGGGPMADFFEKIAPQVGVTAEQFRNLSGPEALQLYYDSLEKANLGQEDMTFYMEAIASDSTALIPLLASGGKGFQELGQEAVNSGLVMSQATAAALAESQNAIDKFKQKAVIFVGRIISGAGDGAALKEFGLKLLAQFLKLGEHIANIFIDAGRVLDAVFVASVGVFKKAFLNAFMASVEILKPVIDKIIEGMNFVLRTDIKPINLESIKSDIDELTKGTKTWGEAWKARMEETKDIKADVSEVTDQLNRQANAEKGKLDAINAIHRATEATLKAVKQTTQEKEKQVAYFGTEIENYRGLQESIASGNEQEIRAAQKRIDDLALFNDLKSQGKFSDEEALAIVEQQNAELRKQQGLHKNLLNATLAQNNRAITAAQLEIDLKERARAIADETGMAFDDAIEKARELMQMEFGPDLDMSGFATRGEQRKFKRRQKRIAAMNKAQEIAEQGIERHRGGGTPQAQRREGRMGTLVEGGKVINLRNATERRRELKRIEEEGKKKAAAEQKELEAAQKAAGKGDMKPLAAFVAKDVAEKIKKKEPQKPKPATMDDVVKQLTTANDMLTKIEGHLQC